jgi:hypothetical protein
MRLPVIRGFVEIANNNGVETLDSTVKFLEGTSEVKGMKQEELDVIGELLSNIFGAQEVLKDMQTGTSQADALNGFMKRVMGSIDLKK